MLCFNEACAQFRSELRISPKFQLHSMDLDGIGIRQEVELQFKFKSEGTALKFQSIILVYTRNMFYTKKYYHELHVHIIF